MEETNYCVTIKTYKTEDTPMREFTADPMPWVDALKHAQGASAIAQMIWTRHNAVNGIIRHMDKYQDLFNEGVIIIEKYE